MGQCHLWKQAPTCPLCGNDNAKKCPHHAKLYGHWVCRKCYHGFANRRQFAFIIDCVLWGLLYRLLAEAADAVLRIFHPPQDLIHALLNILLWLFGATFLLKDGLRGMSPGKAAMGVYVVEEATGERGGRAASSKRNLPLAVPLAFLIIAFQLVKGYRWGDRWANTRVIWRKYRHKAPFVV